MGWHLELAGQERDLAKIQARPRHIQFQDYSEAVPPFRGRSARLLTKAEACAELSCSLSHLEKQLREGMIFPDPIGRRVRIPIEECQNYRDRERLRYRERHA